MSLFLEFLSPVFGPTSASHTVTVTVKVLLAAMKSSWLPSLTFTTLTYCTSLPAQSVCPNPNLLFSFLSVQPYTGLTLSFCDLSFCCMPTSPSISAFFIFLIISCFGFFHLFFLMPIKVCSIHQSLPDGDTPYYFIHLTSELVFLF